MEETKDMSESGKVAKYVLLAQTLKRKIDEEEWVEGSAIPTERDISENFDVSRSTVRKAILLMTEEGYLRSEHGSGTFVMPRMTREHLYSLHSFSDDISSKGEIPNQQILEMVVVSPTDFLREKLGLQAGSSKVQKIKRLRFSGTTPIGIHTAFLPLGDMKALTQEELLDSKSLYRLIKSKWNLKPVEAVESISARLPSPTECSLLEIPANEALITCCRITFSSKYKPMEYVEMVYPSSRYNYKIRINRSSFQS